SVARWPVTKKSRLLEKHVQDGCTTRRTVARGALLLATALNDFGSLLQLRTARGGVMYQNPEFSYWIEWNLICNTCETLRKPPESTSPDSPKNGLYPPLDGRKM